MPGFTGAYAEYALADAAMIARKPQRLNYVAAASVPVVASTAWQMVFDYGQVDGTKCVLVHGAAGNVGAYAVQFAKRTGAQVIATAFSRDVDYVRGLRADHVIDVPTVRYFCGRKGTSCPGKKAKPGNCWISQIYLGIRERDRMSFN